MTLKLLERIVEEAYERYNEKAQNACSQVNGCNKFTVVLNSEQPYIGERYFDLIEEVKSKIKTNGGSIQEMGFYGNSYIMFVT